MRGRVVGSWIAIAISATACTTAAPDGSATPLPTTSPLSVAEVKIAFIEDLSSEEVARTAPAFQGAKLAIDTAILAGNLPVQVELVALDTKGNRQTAAEVAREIAADPSYVAAIGAPFLTGQLTLGHTLDAAGVPMITLSALGPDLPENGWTTWRRAVANQEQQGRALAEYVDGLAGSSTGVCLLGDGSAESTGLLRAVAASLRAPVALRARIAVDGGGTPEVVTRVGRARCRVTVWSGSSSAGALVRQLLVQAGLRHVAFVGGDALKDETYLSVAAGAGAGTVVACACVDLANATDLPAQRFIQDYQSDFGVPPGAYAAEAFDLARILLRAIKEGAHSRRDVLAFLGEMPPFAGLANTYAFLPNGELAPGSAKIHLYRDEGGRWIAVGPSPGALDPVVPGSLTVATCRTGSPLSYHKGGRWVGFDVDVARAVTRRLGLRLAWAPVPCDVAIREVRLGRADAVLLSSRRLSGTPGLQGSKVVLSLRQALTVDLDATPRLATVRGLGKDDVVGVVRGSPGERWAVHQLAPGGIGLRRFATPSAAFDRLEAGHLAAVVDQEARSWAEIEHRPSLAVVQAFDVGDHEVFGVRASHPPLLEAINDALARVAGSGTYARLFARYFPGAEVAPETLSSP